MSQHLKDKYDKYKEILVLCKIAKTASLLEKELEEKMPVIENYNKVKILKRF